jgi:hypothetical protein
MIIKFEFTPFRRMMRPLSLYSAKNRSDDPNARLKWEVSEDIRILGYQQPDYQTRLTEIRLYRNNLPALSDDDHEFLTVLPTISGLGVVAGGDDIMIETEPGKNFLTLSANNFTYNCDKITNIQKERPQIKRYYLPMKNIKIRGSISTKKLQKLAYISPCGPLRLKICDNKVKFISNGERDRAFLDLTNDVTVNSDNINNDFLYDPYLITETLQKFPSNEQIELTVNENLIRFRYELGNRRGHINHYQRGKVDDSRRSW